MNKANLHPFLYEIEPELLRNYQINVLYLPPKLYDIIKIEQRINGRQINDDNNINLGGLSAMLGWAAPEIDLFKIALDQRRKKTLSFWVFDSKINDDLLTQRLVLALKLWLGCTLPKENVEAKRAIKQHSKNLKWHSYEIDTSIVKKHTCIIPKDPNLFDLSTIIAARALEDSTMNQSTKFEGFLVSEGPSKSLYNGKTLLRYEPSEVQRRKDIGWWTEIVTVSSLSSPEQSNLRIAVRMGMRNFITVHKSRLSYRKNRKADIFMLSDAHLAPGTSRRRCLDLDIKRSDFDIANGSEEGRYSNDRKVLKYIMSFSGINLNKEELETLGLNPIGGPNQKIWMLPRFGTVHGDKWAPGGTGIPKQERRTSLEFLDSIFEKQGFKRVLFEKKRNLGSKPIFKIIGDKKELRKQGLRKQTLKLLEKYKKNRLDIVLFQSTAESYELLKNAVIEVLGECDKASDGLFTYNEWCCPKCSSINEEMATNLKCESCKNEFEKAAITGLGIKIIKIPTGPLGQRIDRIDDSGISKLRKDLYYREKRRLQIGKSSEALEKITHYINEQLGETTFPWCALVEQRRILCDEEPARDPYRLVYHAIASKDGVAQVVLTDDEENDSKNELHKYQKSFLDLLRTIGVAPLSTPKAKKRKKSSISSDGIRLAAWLIINTQDSGRWQPGQKESMLTPIYIHFDDEELSVSFLTDKDELVTCPYHEAWMRITLGELYNLRSLKFDKQILNIERFFADAVPTDKKQTVTFIDAMNVRSYVRGFLNSSGLILDEIKLGAIGGTDPYRKLALKDNISFIRITDEKAKSPSYWVDGNRQGTVTGVFQEQNAKRTFWISRGLIDALQQSSWPKNISSRHEESAKQFGHRRFPSLSELLVQVNATDKDSSELIRLARTLFKSHVTTSDEIMLPFPLHEGMLLKKVVR
jgi:hypothetical protein